MRTYFKHRLAPVLCCLFYVLIWVLSGCKNHPEVEKLHRVHLEGTMKDVLWDGKLEGKIFLDTLRDKNNLYGLGPEAFLNGELLVMGGKSYTGRVLSDSTMTVKNSFAVKAPFFVYSYVLDWEMEVIPSHIRSISDLENWLAKKTENVVEPFAFKLTGNVKSAQIHLQNLPKGSTVSSPAEAHRGQKKYSLQNKEVVILGFFSKQHKGVFTHHDSFVHLHLITKDLRFTGHLDAIDFGGTPVVLYLPENLM